MLHDRLKKTLKKANKFQNQNKQNLSPYIRGSFWRLQRQHMALYPWEFLKIATTAYVFNTPMKKLKYYYYIMIFTIIIISSVKSGLKVALSGKWYDQLTPRKVIIENTKHWLVNNIARNMLSQKGRQSCRRT